MPTGTARSRRTRAGLWALLALVLPGGLGGCSDERSAALSQASPPLASTARSATRQRLRELRASEQARRAELSPREQPPWLDVSGADPYRLAAWPEQSGYVGVLRGAKALVTLGPELQELSRAALPEWPTALCLRASDEALVASRYAPDIVRVKLGRGARARVVGRWHIGAARSSALAGGIADLACGQEDGLSYVLPAGGGDLLTLDSQGQVLGRFPALPGGLRLLRRGRFLLESSLFERSLRVLELDARGVPQRELSRIRRDGPIWAFDAALHEGELLIALAGVEDKPLVRAHGEFENIDSFVWLYRGSAAPQQMLALDVGELGLVVPKAVALRVGNAGELSLSALAAGSGVLLRARYANATLERPQLSVQPALPGVSDAVFADASVAYASPLFDGWVLQRSGSSTLVPVDPETRPALRIRLGEALFFSELIAPDNDSAGSHSRFSCETCHFEGGVDGRTHYTGRQNISVVTKPLFGLANNRPHFSRALDPDLTAVSHNEFRVAGAGSGTDPWFTLPVARFGWLHELGVDRAQLSPFELRQALTEFLYAFSHAPNARALGRVQFTAQEGAGATAFQQHCVRCHRARLFSDQPASEVAFADWESLVLSRNAPIVWARSDYARTGVRPYVHELGTRVPSLRRLQLKPRYFTNGSAPDLAAVLASFRNAPDDVVHHRSPSEQNEPNANALALSAVEQRALLAFLQLL